MKHTKSHIIKPTEESRELLLYIENDGTLYRQTITPIINNLRRKIKAGTYNEQKAIDAFYYAAEAGAKKYAREFSHPEDYKYIFDVTCRYTTAAGLLNSFLDEINE